MFISHAAKVTVLGVPSKSAAVAVPGTTAYEMVAGDGAGYVSWTLSVATPAHSFTKMVRDS
mgnify:CR=1 FL=1